jgi:alpha-glucuronidase
LISVPKNSQQDAGLKYAIAREGFRIRSLKFACRSVTEIASSSEVGALYVEAPRLQLRVLNHWDNLDGSVERGYAGRSLWDWNALPDRVDLRLRDYARANASLGINGAFLRADGTRRAQDGGSVRSSGRRMVEEKGG